MESFQGFMDLRCLDNDPGLFAIAQLSAIFAGLSTMAEAILVGRMMIRRCTSII